MHRFCCEEGAWYSTTQCSLQCQGGLCTETYDGKVVCSSCNATTDEQPYKREEFRDAFADTNMSDWKVYSCQFHASPAGLRAEAATAGEAIVYNHMMADLIFEADLTLTDAGAGGDVGLVFRATQPDSYDGGSYYAGISPSSGQMFLSRMPDNVQLALAKLDTQAKRTIHIKVQAVNKAISVYAGHASRYIKTPRLKRTSMACMFTIRARRLPMSKWFPW